MITTSVRGGENVLLPICKENRIEGLSLGKF
jgi:hypothetical protein